MSLVKDADAQKRILNRLKRANGQLTALIAAAEGGANCKDVITQLSAVSSALDRAGYAIIASAMKDCLSDDAPENQQNLTAEELEKLFLTLA